MRKFISIVFLLVSVLFLGGCLEGVVGAGSLNIDVPLTWDNARAQSYQQTYVTNVNYDVRLGNAYHSGPNQNQINEYWASRNNRGW